MENLFSDYLENCSEDRLKKAAGGNQDIKREFEDLKDLYHTIRKPGSIDTDPEMDLAIFDMIEKEKRSIIEEDNLRSLRVTFLENPELTAKSDIKAQAKSEFRRDTNIYKYAAAVILMAGIFWLGRLTSGSGFADLKEFTALKKDVQETRQMVMLEMMSRESASERIQAVNYSFDIENPDTEVLEALVKTLNSDSNTNVRTAAAEALSHFGNKKIARNALIQALTSQKDPTLQIVIIDILANLGEKRAVKPIQQLLQNSNTEDFVKRKAKESVEILNTI